jgi:hypothetical protein
MQANPTCTTIKSNLVLRTQPEKKQQLDRSPDSREGQHKAMTEREEQEQVARLAAQLAFIRATTAKTEEEKAARQAAQLAFLKAGLEEYQRYNAVDVVEEYRRAGKLHTYDPDKEKQKHFAS